MSNFFEYNTNLLESETFDIEYSKIFYDRYSAAKKKKIDDLILEEDDEFDDYQSWINKYELLVKEYTKFLRYIDLNPTRFKKISPIELFKGSFDSLKKSNGNLWLFTKYANTFNQDGKKLGIQLTDITVRDGVPNHIIKTENGKVYHIPFNTTGFDTIYVHNPYNKREETMIHKLLDNDNLCVIYGLYGFSEEENIDEKIEHLKELRDKLTGAKLYEVNKETNNLGKIHMGVIYKPRIK